jgi:hypothetical protein
LEVLACLKSGQGPVGISTEAIIFDIALFIARWATAAEVHWRRQLTCQVRGRTANQDSNNGYLRNHSREEIAHCGNHLRTPSPRPPFYEAGRHSFQAANQSFIFQFGTNCNPQMPRFEPIKIRARAQNNLFLDDHFFPKKTNVNLCRKSREKKICARRIRRNFNRCDHAIETTFRQGFDDAVDLVRLEVLSIPPDDPSEPLSRQDNIAFLPTTRL